MWVYSRTECSRISFWKLDEHQRPSRPKLPYEYPNSSEVKGYILICSMRNKNISGGKFYESPCHEFWMLYTLFCGKPILGYRSLLNTNRATKNYNNIDLKVYLSFWNASLTLKLSVVEIPDHKDTIFCHMKLFLVVLHEVKFCLMKSGK